MYILIKTFGNFMSNLVYALHISVSATLSYLHVRAHTNGKWIDPAKIVSAKTDYILQRIQYYG